MKLDIYMYIYIIHTSPSRHCHFYTVCTAVLTLDFILLQINFVSYICEIFRCVSLHKHLPYLFTVRFATT